MGSQGSQDLYFGSRDLLTGTIASDTSCTVTYTDRSRLGSLPKIHVYNTCYNKMELSGNLKNLIFEIHFKLELI